MRFLLTLKAEYVRYGILLRRYPIEPVANVLVLFLLFLIMYAGFKPASVNAGLYDASATNALTGYVLWFFVILAISGVSAKIEDEAKLGTLEQVCLHSHDLLTVWLCRIWVDLTFGLFQVAVLGTLILAATSLSIQVSVPMVVAFVLTIAAIYGFGFMLGGLSLVFKRVGESRAVLQMVFLILAVVPPHSLPAWLYSAALLSPLTVGLEAMRAVNQAGGLEWATLVPRLPVLALNACCYVTLGVCAFAGANQLARRDGLLAQY